MRFVGALLRNPLLAGFFMAVALLGWGEDYQGESDTHDLIHRTQAASDRLAALLVAAIEKGEE